jgi:hypothetical protein
LIAGLGLVAPGSLARFTDATGPTGSFSADVLDPPTSLAASGGASVALTWTPTVDGYATGYEVLRGITSGGPYGLVDTVTPSSASSTTDAPATGTYVYVLRSYFQNWTSTDSNEAEATVNGGSTGLRSCSAQAASPGGDGDGYQTNPLLACADDASFAQDANSGTGPGLGCTSVQKDRHAFWGYGLGVPLSATSIDGIEVRLDALVTPAAAPNRLCVELSWNGGTSWTTPKQVNFASSTETTYWFGSATDTWGRTWLPAQLADPQFRVRVTDASDATTKTFSLDYVAVQVTYTP